MAICGGISPARPHFLLDVDMRVNRWSDRVRLLSDYVGGRTIARISKHSGLPEADVSKTLHSLIRQARSKDALLPDLLPEKFDRYLESRLRSALKLCAATLLRSGSLSLIVLFLGIGVFVAARSPALLDEWVLLILASIGAFCAAYLWWQLDGVLDALQHDGDVRAIVEKKLRKSAEMRARIAEDSARSERSAANAREASLRAKVDELNASLSDSVSAVHIAETALSSAKASNGELRGQVAALQYDKQRLITECAKITERSSKLEARLADISQQKSAAESMHLEAVTNYCAEIQRIQNEKQELQRLLTRIETRDEADVRRLVDPGTWRSEARGWRERIATRHDGEVVLFADICGFTQSSSDRDPSEVARELCDLIAEIDGMASRFGMGRIKTIGDCVLMVSRLFTTDSAQSKARNALEFAEHLMLQEKYWFQALPWKVSIAVGPIASAMLSEEVASIDIWGATVNRAARLLQLAGTKNTVVIDGAAKTALSDRGLGRFRDCRIEIEGKGIEKQSCWILTPV